MKLSFNLIKSSSTESIDIDITTCIVAGWAGRDPAAIQHHIEELALLGVPRPSAVPLYYRIASSQLTQESEVEVVGNESSGEAEVFIFSYQGNNLVSLASDHTDRKLEAHSVALSKQICAKPIARDAWLYSDVADHWDQLILRSWIQEAGQEVLYQEGTLASLRQPLELVKDHFGQAIVPTHSGMTCGTVAAIGGIRPAPVFTMELADPKLQRTLRHSYALRILPEIA